MRAQEVRRPRLHVRQERGHLRGRHRLRQLRRRRVLRRRRLLQVRYGHVHLDARWRRDHLHSQDVLRLSFRHVRSADRWLRGCDHCLQFDRRRPLSRGAVLRRRRHQPLRLWGRRERPRRGRHGHPMCTEDLRRLSGCGLRATGRRLRRTHRRVQRDRRGPLRWQPILRRRRTRAVRRHFVGGRRTGR